MTPETQSATPAPYPGYAQHVERLRAQEELVRAIYNGVAGLNLVTGGSYAEEVLVWETRLGEIERRVKAAETEALP